MANRNVSKLTLSKPISRNSRQVDNAIREYEQEKTELLTEMMAEDTMFEEEHKKYFTQSEDWDDYWYNFRNQPNFDGFDGETHKSCDTSTSAWEDENDERLLEEKLEEQRLARRKEFVGVDWEARHCMGEG